MRIARKLLVVGVLTAATMAFGASSASAVEISSGGNHCTPVAVGAGHVVTGGCKINATSERETEVQAFVSGVGFVTISTCEDVFEARIAEDGTGYLYLATTTGHGDPPCTRTACDEAAPSHRQLPWALNLTATNNMEIDFCLRTIQNPDVEGAAGTTCHTNIAITPNNGTGAHEFSANGTTSGSCENLGGGVRVLGHWNINPSGSHPAINIAP